VKVYRCSTEVQWVQEYYRGTGVVQCHSCQEQYIGVLDYNMVSGTVVHVYRSSTAILAYINGQEFNSYRRRTVV